MTISKLAKEEIADAPQKGCCRRARFSALLRTAGSILFDANGMRVQLSTDNPAVSEFAASYVFERYGGEVNIKNGKHISVVFSGDYVARLLVEAGALSGEKDGYGMTDGILPFLVKGNCCMREYIRGAFLGCGFISSDISHLEFAFSSHDVAADFAGILALSPGAPSETVRGDKYIVYYKSRNKICDVLSYMGATKAVLKANDIIVRGDVTRKVMARRNCDLANIDRALKASEEQVAAINLIDHTLGLEKLDDKLSTIAFIRQANPSATLAELADISGLTKSGVKHRLDKLMETAEKLEKQAGK